MANQPDAAPLRLLPYDVAVATPWALEAPGATKQPTPPSYEEVADRIAPSTDPDKWFSPIELRTANWLRSRGLDVRSIERREGHLQRTPDAAAAIHRATVELKSASGSVNSIVQRIRDGRWQSRHVVVDIRGTGATLTTAEAGIHHALIRYQRDLEDLVVLVTDDLSVGWSHG